ncbi:Fbox domain containing protein [Acanthamoeba castellanii str. Neff]|uniref:Fbox domain containing protein n=1 Tax=Acanthamoeba castellanii (strain ATCC 30010 / Neff) TaxID=1257118 RepID=L8GP20_ACACF|nr:Fbox domain containing protein [Acanthamoeba castellanii str. Neff]ELR13891.1 Fbox domain containing protein [Acanthamoeba castellanii str. Neff]
MAATPPLDELPADVLLHVLSFVVAGAGSAREAAAALCRVGGACSSLREVASSDHLWRRLARESAPHWRFRPLPSTDDQRARWVHIVRAAHTKPKPKPTVTAARLFDDDDDLFSAVHVKTDPLNAAALQEPKPEPEPELEVEVPTTYKQLYLSMPPPPVLYTDERWFDDACRMATLVVHAAVKHPPPKRPGVNSLFGSDDDDDGDIFALPPSRSGVLEVLHELHGHNPSRSSTIGLTFPHRTTPGQVGVWMLVCSGGRYFNVGPPSSPFPLAAWTTGGLRERFESVRAQETEDRRGRTTAIASQVYDRHDFDWCGSGGLFDDDDAYKAWHIKSWHEGEPCRQLSCPAAARSVAGLHVWPPELAAVAGWANGHFLTQEAGGLLYFHLVNGVVLSSWRIESSGVVRESFCRAPLSRLTPSDVFAANATELPSGQKVMTHDQFLAGLAQWTNRDKQCVVSPTGVHVLYDVGRGFPHVRQCRVYRLGAGSLARSNREFVLDSDGDKVAAGRAG